MVHRSLTVGSAQVTAICDVVGDFPAPLDLAFPAVEWQAWEPYRRRYPEAFNGTDRWRLRVWCFLVRAGGRLTLVDTGVGAPWTPGARWIGAPGRLPAELAAAGVDPNTVELVVLTHLHLDHVGWNLAWEGERPRALFPRARHLVQRADWEWFARQGGDNDRAAFERCVRPLETLGLAELVEGDQALDGGLRVLHTPGHTPGSQSLLVASGGDAVLLWGDVANHPAQVSESSWCSRGDLEPETTRRTREVLLDRAEAEGLWLAPAHFPEPFGSLIRVEGRRHWSPGGPGAAAVEGREDCGS
jgi:glyoxylase-like metal-dependent hydrolase (beta-lactamase superfamily II)